MRELVCIVCPNSCLLKITEKDGEIVVEGAKCKKGIEFAKEELTAPRRSLSSTIKSVFAELPVVPVRTKEEVLKQDIGAIMQEINACLIDKVYSVGDTVIKNVAGSGEDVICTVEIKRYIKGERI